MIRIGVDMLGGDFGLKEAVPGVKEYLLTKLTTGVELVLFGDPTQLEPLTKLKPGVTIVPTTEAVDMGEHDPMGFVRSNKTSSLILALQALKNQEIDGLLTAGPTQVVMTGAYLIVKKSPLMRRIALAPVIPSLDGKGKIMLDTGGNVTLDAPDLLEFALYGTELARLLFHEPNPGCALLNIGTEAGKGREFEKQAYQLLENEKKINFLGNIEGKDLLTTDAKIILQDGFSNNIALKTLEGTAKIFAKTLKQEIKSSLGGKIGYLFMRKNLARFQKTFDTSNVGGATLLGAKSLMVKIHGASQAKQYLQGLIQVQNLLESQLIAKVEKNLAELKNAATN
jgi:glycerol-3-phosphate acyltransferase PlsX